MIKKLIILLFIGVLAAPAGAQVPDTVTLKRHITYLASDALEGRETGTKGEQLAMEYLSEEFRVAGLAPAGEKGYVQPFAFNAGSYASENNTFKIGKKSYLLNESFYPLAYAANAGFKGKTINVGYGIAAPGRNDYEGTGWATGSVAVMEYGYPSDIDLHSKMGAYADTRTRIDSAFARGAVAVLFVNSDAKTENPSAHFSNRTSPTSIPVLFVYGSAATALSENKNVVVSGTTEILKKEKTGHNVIGFINNNAPFTIVIGAHYDHLGYGIEGSLYRGDKKEIHNGADDNASGTAGLLELAAMIKKAQLKKYNFLFIAFSGEEMGLLGSSYLVKHLPLAAGEISCMLNMDMIGRLKPDEPVLLINGVGTSPTWKEAMNDIQVAGLKTKTTESGMGPSDHASFYLKDIPVLHFFSGTHEDYHKPSDDFEKINYDGTQKILTYMFQLITVLDKKDKLTFTKTVDSNNEETPRFKVTLGVVPDYAYDGEGMRIDGVSENKPAQKAGLLAGDIVIKLGDHTVADMMSYMKALGNFTKGDKTIVTVKRGDGVVTKEIEF
jgi:aminopeptidase YwaD